MCVCVCASRADWPEAGSQLWVRKRLNRRQTPYLITAEAIPDGPVSVVRKQNDERKSDEVKAAVVLV